MKLLWCWRCQMNVPMLEAAEWDEVRAALEQGIGDIKSHRETTGSELRADLVQRRHRSALDVYERLTGFRETNPNALWHHRVSLYGDPCPECSKPLRTPKARMCAACGWGMESTGTAQDDGSGWVTPSA